MSNIAKMIAIAKRFGGGTSAPSEVVILPETELTPTSVSEDMGLYYLYAPLENTPAAGAKCKLMWGGTEYTNTVVDITATMGAPAFLLGNTDLVAEDGMKFDNPDADAPYCTMFVPGGMPSGEGGQVAYGMIMSMGIIPEPPVLSIVQVGGASEDSGSDGGILTVNCSISTQFVDSTTVFSNADKTWGEIKAAHESGKIVRFVAKDNATPPSEYIGSVRGVLRMNGAEVMSIMFPKRLIFDGETLCSAGLNTDGVLHIAPSTFD